MSFNVSFMVNSSDNNYLYKSLSTIRTVSGDLKKGTSILNPTILFSGSIPNGCNYLHIPEFNRYYFVNDIRAITNNMFEISAHVDVLQTYASNLENCEGIVARNENEWNLYIDDGSFKVYSNPQLALKNFTGGFSGYSYVMAIAGGN